MFNTFRAMRRFSIPLLAFLSAFAARAQSLPGKPLSGDGMLVKTSSTSQWDSPELHLSLVRGQPVSCAFHTNKEKKPWVAIRLAAPAEVTGIEVTNRTDGSEFRTEPLVVSVSADGKTWKQVFRSEKAEPKWSIPLSEPAAGTQWVRFELDRGNAEYFHLSRVVIYAR